MTAEEVRARLEEIRGRFRRTEGLASLDLNAAEINRPVRDVVPPAIELLEAVRIYRWLDGETVGHARTCPCRPCARRKRWATFCARASEHTPDYEGVMREVARDV